MLCLMFYMNLLDTSTAFLQKTILLGRVFLWAGSTANHTQLSGCKNTSSLQTITVNFEDTASKQFAS